ncbi:ADP-ribose diphosphatase [Paraferrimonas sedimenticola]|uniref:ADP-ribose pyrophosphatase n=1 Tax=Paraferrimonas sedimenticola TaxID=375674 RepID=A0AA37RY57_9GAMM|nr:ADP-ribose diphosphatase [Paraferrimonas sedimenticola]GLP97231.1 ADP-ribose diphosphatase [Paraferrimonas sedimenticola]
MTKPFSSRFDQNDLIIEDQKVLYDGFFQMQSYRFRHKLFQGGWSDSIQREVFERGDAVVVLPYDPIRDQVVLIEQLRLPATGKSPSPWLLELVAGMIDTDQTPEQVALRELHEETGIQASQAVPIYQFLPSPGGCSELLHLYWVEVDATQAVGVHGKPDENEDIRVFAMAREEAFALLASGHINNGATMLGLQWLELNHRRLRGEAQ